MLAAGPGGVEVLAGTAEEIPVAASSVDVVIAQSAWHWVDEDRAVPEVARVLRPAGRLSLVWSGPDRSVDWMRSLSAGGIIFGPEERVAEDSRRRRHLVNVDVGGGSPFLEPETALFQWTRPIAKADLVGLAATYSRVITMESDERTRHLDAMSTISRLPERRSPVSTSSTSPCAPTAGEPRSADPARSPEAPLERSRKSSLIFGGVRT